MAAVCPHKTESIILSFLIIFLLGNVTLHTCDIHVITLNPCGLVRFEQENVDVEVREDCLRVIPFWYEP